MKAILLSGGAGTRLQNIAGGLPKPMMPILGKPLLEHTVSLLREQGFSDLCLTLHYNPEPIRRHFGDGALFGVRMTYQTEKTPLGTAGAVKNCRSFYEDSDEPFLVMSGDSACDFPLSELMAAHRGGVTIGLSDTPEPLAFGLVVTDRRGAVTGFVEKPDWEHVVTDRVSTGTYILDPEVMAHVPPNRPYDFARDLFPRLLELGIPMTGTKLEGYWRDIGTPRSYYQCNLDALDGLYRLPGGPGHTRRVLPCQNRARLMRVMGEALAEYAADFSNGLTLERDGRRSHIAPLAERSALCLEGDAPDVARLEALAKKLEQSPDK